MARLTAILMEPNQKSSGFARNPNGNDDLPGVAKKVVSNALRYDLSPHTKYDD
jgi:hypothetical protein